MNILFLHLCLFIIIKIIQCAIKLIVLVHSTSPHHTVDDVFFLITWAFPGNGLLKLCISRKMPVKSYLISSAYDFESFGGGIAFDPIERSCMGTQ